MNSHGMKVRVRMREKQKVSCSNLDGFLTKTLIYFGLIKDVLPQLLF